MSKTGIFGKHPAFGDFIGAGMSKPMQVALEEWLGAVLPRARDNLGEVWQPFYDIALPLRFWLGEDVLPRSIGGPVAGVMVFSHDKVGRRFPLIALVEGEHMPPPVIVPDQRWYDALQTCMLEHDTPQTAAELAEALTIADGFLPTPFEGGDAGFWAVHSAGQVENLLTNVASTDHRRAAAGRSYWWCAGDASRTATFHSLKGWPDASVFQWLLSGNPADEPDEPGEEIAVESAVEIEPEIEPDILLSTSDEAWSGEGARAVPTALYGDIEDQDQDDVDEGPQSPFSVKPDVKDKSEPLDEGEAEEDDSSVEGVSEEPVEGSLDEEDTDETGVAQGHLADEAKKD